MNAKASEPIDNLSRILDAQDLSPLAKCSKEKRGEAVPKVILYKARGETFFKTESEILAVLVFMNFLYILSLTFLGSIHLDLENRQKMMLV